jgi:hypothetical protein
VFVGPPGRPAFAGDEQEETARPNSQNEDGQTQTFVTFNIRDFSGAARFGLAVLSPARQ